MKNQKSKVRFFKIRFILCRLFAALFDFMAVFVATAYLLIIIAIVLKTSTLFSKDGSNFLTSSVLYLPIFILFTFFYILLCVKKIKNTPGNRLFGIEVISNNVESKVSTRRLMLRFFLQFAVISSIPFIATIFLFSLVFVSFIIFDKILLYTFSLQKIYMEFINNGINSKFIQILSVIIISAYTLISYKLLVSFWKDRSVMDVICSTKIISTGREISIVKSFFIDFIVIFLFVLLFLIF